MPRIHDRTLRIVIKTKHEFGPQLNTAIVNYGIRTKQQVQVVVKRLPPAGVSDAIPILLAKAVTCHYCHPFQTVCASQNPFRTF